MKPLFTKRLSMLLILATLCLSAQGFMMNSASSDDDDDHERARHAVERVEMKPLAEILNRVRKTMKGEIVGVEIEREGGRWVYELRVVSRSGRLTEVYVDGATGHILKTETD